VETMVNRALEKSFNGLLVVEFNFNSQYLQAYNHSHMYGYSLRERDLEAKKLSKRDIERRGKSTWQFHFSELEKHLDDYYHKIALTKSGITAHVRVTGFWKDKDFTEGASNEFSKKVLILYLNDSWDNVVISDF